MTAFGPKPRFAAATLLIAAVAGAAAAPGLAAEPAAPARAAQLQQLLDCRKLTDPTQRLACFDQAAGVLDQAEAKGDVVVVDREQARKVRRQAFGFTLPSMSLFSRGEKPEEITSADGVIASARQLPTGKWEFTLEDGARWVQVDLTEIPLTPKPGQKVKIRTASMGSYAMSVNNQREVKVHREQ
ncbi:hypothetical protein [Phenylobacterium sp.]|uniref:hypothetical protein n=1 Tax=Phenylobacterium sp. TaxID=1871053 RepID=UPI002C590139|nr:hypothetical protein [Phenylobacterium sp.]HLZ76519.1 hypothetical protein [Phenylobacterium sp.]